VALNFVNANRLDQRSPSSNLAVTLAQVRPTRIDLTRDMGPMEPLGATHMDHDFWHFATGGEVDANCRIGARRVIHLHH
jgi:hypothetical protein